MSNRFDLEQLYFSAKESYYNGEPIMSDDEFDRLEQELLTMGSDAPYVVGADDRKAKYSHPSPMLSLAKLQATLDGIPPTEAATNWMKNIKDLSYEITPKYDGNAANAIYQDGKLLQVLSRGNGTKGRDITSKVRHNLPETIQFTGTVEIRGEVVITVETFNKKYSDFKNPRNYVAGVLNRDENPASVIADLDFIPVEVRQHQEDGYSFCTVHDIPGFKHYPFMAKIFVGEFENTYHAMLHYRNNDCEYQLDGFVIKADEATRPRLGENSHDPNWAIAIKFPPKEAITKIIDIQWNWGKSGEVTPVAIMESVDLDGSTVSRATMFNYGYVKNAKAFPGAIVAIAKSGDIIPQIMRVITPGAEENFNAPTHCHCGAHTEVHGIHMVCSDDNCEWVVRNKFHQGVNALDLDGVGGSMVGSLWDAGFRSPFELLNPTKFNKERLLATGHFKDGKILDNLFAQLSRVKELKPHQIVYMLGLDRMGSTASKQVGNYLSGVKYNFSGLEKSVVAGFGPGEPKRALYESAVAEISPFIKIVMPEQISEDSIGYEMTGSPKAFGFKTKEEFVAYAKSKGYHHSGLKDGKVLFVDDLNTSSSKMKTAQAKGIKIMLYSEI
jgi:DNA ligase (NAD+)